jgi:hypothetical protein
LIDSTQTKSSFAPSAKQHYLQEKTLFSTIGEQKLVVKLVNGQGLLGNLYVALFEVLLN